MTATPRPNDGHEHVWEPISGAPGDSWWRCTACVARQQRLTLYVGAVARARDARTNRVTAGHVDDAQEEQA